MEVQTAQAENDSSRPDLTHAERHQEKTRRFWDRVASGYAKKQIGNQSAYEHKLAKTREYLNAESQVLELGCGTGTTALVHAPHAKHILATDVSGEMLAIAEQKRLDAGIGNVSFVRSSAEAALASLAVKGTYDAVLALNLLHLIDDWKGLIEQASRCLPEDGVLVTSTLCFGRRYALLRWLGPLGFRLGLLPRLRFFSENELKAAFERQGFTLEYCWQADTRNGLFVVARKRHASS